MVFLMHNSSSSSKAQFFILSVFLIVTILFFVSKWMQPGTIIDTSDVVMTEEPFIFNNLAEKAKETVDISRSCEDLKFNLEEYKDFVEKYATQKGKMFLQYQLSSPCRLPSGKEIPTVVIFDLNMTSPRVNIHSHFYRTWLPS